MAVTTSGITVDDLDLPNHPRGYVQCACFTDTVDNVQILYAPLHCEGRARLQSSGDRYCVSFEHYPTGKHAVQMTESECFDSFGEALEQLATWMCVDIEEFLDENEGDT